VLSSYTQLLPPAGGWKLVVVHNGHDDGSAGIAQSFADRLPLVAVSEPRRGKNRALNSGLRELEGDLAVFTDDDCLPDADWLVRLRAAADSHPDHAIFGGAISLLWTQEPEDWIARCVRMAPTFAVTDPAREEGPCDPARVWGPNMAIRREPFDKGFRFDERLGPNGSQIYAMGGETEFTLRLAMAEQAKCWHCADARVRHIVTQEMMTRGWMLRRAFRLGRCLCRESRQRRAARGSYVQLRPAGVKRYFGRKALKLAFANANGAERWFVARWQLALALGWLLEAWRGLGDARCTPGVTSGP
jgi:glycosyltransferase involved in cell wall biosynthesis